MAAVKRELHDKFWVVGVPPVVFSEDPMVSLKVNKNFESISYNCRSSYSLNLRGYSVATVQRYSLATSSHCLVYSSLIRMKRAGRER